MSICVNVSFMSAENFELVGGTVPDEVFFSGLVGAANHEAKLVVLGILASQAPGSLLSRGQLYDEVIGAQGEEPGWLIDERGPVNYCRMSFLPNGLVEPDITMNKGQRSTAFVVPDSARMFAMALTGASLEYALDNDIPEAPTIQSILGSTHTVSRLTAPEGRYRTLRALIEHGNHDNNTQPSYTELSRLIGQSAMTPEYVSDVVGVLSERGITAFRNKVQSIDALLLNRGTENSLRPADAKSEASKQLLLALEAHFATGATIAHFEDICQAVGGTAVTYRQMAKAWGMLLGSRSRCDEGSLSAYNEFRTDQRSMVTLNPVAAPHITDYIERMEAARTSPEEREKFSRVAQSILSKPKHVARLMKIAREGSQIAKSSTNGSGEGLSVKDMIVEVISSFGHLSARELTTSLNILYGRNLQIRSVRDAGKMLVKDGFLAESTKPGRTNARESKYYNLPKPE
jgi:hypothetical protein